MRHPSQTMGEGIAASQGIRRRRIIERPRLMSLLDGGQGRIRMLVAPAGYGKTTLARQWLEGKPAAWYTGTPASTDVAALAAGVRTAWRLSFRKWSRAHGAVARHGTSRGRGTMLAGMLAGDLAVGRPKPGWCSTTITRLPERKQPSSSSRRFSSRRQSMCLVVGRRRPGWASSRRILYGEVFELDRSALAMTDDEARELLSQSRRGLQMSPGESPRLARNPRACVDGARPTARAQGDSPPLRIFCRRDLQAS